MKPTLPPIALTLALLTSVGCASLPPLGGEASERRAEAERRIVELEKEATRNRIELERLRERVARLEQGAPRARPAPAAPPAATVPPSTPPPAAPAPAITPAIEQTDLEDEPISPASQPAGVTPPADQAAAYEAALAQLRDGNAAAAERDLLAFVEAHPTSDLADNAWFWIGEARLVRQEVAGALTAYRTAVETHPDGNKTPDALFKIGHCLALSGDTARATEVWEELARRFPHTAAAQRAVEALAASPGAHP